MIGGVGRPLDEVFLLNTLCQGFHRVRRLFDEAPQLLLDEGLVFGNRLQGDPLLDGHAFFLEDEVDLVVDLPCDAAEGIARCFV